MTKPTPKTRISAKTRAFLTFSIEHGLSRAEAAAKAGISDNWAYQQMRRPEVLALRREMMEVLRTSEASRTIKRIAALADGSRSDAVKLDSAKWLADAAGEGPVARGEVHHLHSGQVPGLTIVFAAPAPQMLDVTPVAPALTSRVAVTGTSKPHPSQGEM